ncbi:MAG: hypothetical protein QM742_07810 [Aquabacterium sp.]
MTTKKEKPPKAPKPIKEKKPTQYALVIEKLFKDRYTAGATSIDFNREDLLTIATSLGVSPKNIGDLLYSFRFRNPLPPSIISTQPEGREWIIQLAGRARYRFRLAKANRIVPNKSLATIKIPDSTPEIIARYKLDDEQGLLAKVRYNRLLDIFLGLTTYSLQNHLRTTVEDLGQIEIDELYVGLDRHGCHYIIPVQAKGGKDQISIVQTEQDTRWCAQEFPDLRCRAISVQFAENEQIAIFELKIEDSDLLELKIVEEKHYKLVPSDQLDKKQISDYRT